MDELQYGDKVQSINSKGEVIYSDVYLFGHRNSNVTSSMISLATSLHTVTMAPTHYARICVANCDAGGLVSKATKFVNTYAKDVKVGDIVLELVGLVDSRDDAGLVFSPVLHIGLSLEVGLYAPFVKDTRNIIVDGVVASVHAKWYFDDTFGTEWATFLTDCVITLPYFVYHVVGPTQMNELVEYFGFHSADYERNFSQVVITISCWYIFTIAVLLLPPVLVSKVFQRRLLAKEKSD